MFERRPLFLAVGIALGTLSLSGCGSSGGGGNNSQGSFTFEGSDTDSGITLEPGLVRVAVADSAFDVATITNPERIIDSLDVYTNSTDVSGIDEWHGNAIASTITGGTLGNARLDLLKIEDSQGATLNNALDFAIGEAAARGARVVNASFSRRLEASDPRLSFKGITSAESYQRVVSSNDGKGAVYVVSAGNSGSAIDTQGRPIYEQQPDLYSMMLIAVGTTEDNNIHPASSYPGEDERLQERTLGTSFINRELGVQGTSISAARLSEFAAGIFAQWPHLSAQQASQRLLDTAFRGSPLFQQNNCGAAGTLNCGAFFLGQGEADIVAALAPAGQLVISQSQQVSEGGELANASYMQLSSAYGNAIAASGALNDVAVFDALGRDYQMNLGLNAQPRTHRATQLRDQMERLSMASSYTPRTQSAQIDNYRFTSRVDGTGELLSGRFDGSFGLAQLSAFGFAGNQPSPMSNYAEAAIMPMISFQEGSALTQAFDTVGGVKTRYGLGDHLSITASHWASGLNNAQSTSEYQAYRSDVGLDLQVSPAISLSSYVGQLDEQQGLLGASGAGALGFGEQNQIVFAGVGFQASFDNGLNGFAELEQGRGNAVGNGLLARIDDISTQKMALGLQWTGSGQRSDERAALTLRQPLRISSANATFDIPVGRSIEGEVIRETRSVSLAPSGRQVDVELGYAFKTGFRSLWQVNILHTLEPGHDAEAKSDSAAMVNYSYTW